MRDSDLLQLALGLVPPWLVKTCSCARAASAARLMFGAQKEGDVRRWLPTQ